MGVESKAQMVQGSAVAQETWALPLWRDEEGRINLQILPFFRDQFNRMKVKIAMNQTIRGSKCEVVQSVREVIPDQRKYVLIQDAEMPTGIE